MKTTMNAFVEISLQVVKGIPSIFLNPILYVFILLIYLQYRRQTLTERRLFHIGIHAPAEQTLQTLLYGMIGGLCASALFAFIGVIIRLQDFIYIWAIALVLVLFNVRYLCLAYASGILGILCYVTRGLPESWLTPGWAWLWEPMMSIDVPSMMALVAVLHMIEAFLVRVHGAQGALPLFVDGRRGRLVGAFQLQKFWLLPLFLMIAVEEGSGGVSLSSAWWPVVAGGGVSFIILPLPAVIGFSDMAISRTKKAKAIMTSHFLWLYSILLFILALCAVWMGAFWGIAAALFSFIGHELMLILGQRREWNRPPYFVQSDKGIRILDVIPESPAAQMGIESGETIMKVNGRPVNRKEDLYPALQLNPAFCKLDVVSREGVTKYLQRSLYAGEHHQLGVIIAPDLQSQYYVKLENVNIVQLIRQRIRRRKREQKGA